MGAVTTSTLTNEPTKKYEPTQPKPVIPRTPTNFKAQAVTEGEIAVFNRSHGMLGYMERDFPYIEIPAGRWTKTTTSGKPIPKDFVYRYLLNNPDVSVQIPYKPLRGDKTHLTIASPIDSVNGWGLCASNIINELAKLRLSNKVENPNILYSPKTIETPSLFQDVSVDWNELAAQSDLMLFPLANWHYQEQPDLVQALMRKPHHPTEWTFAMTIPSELPQVPSPNIVLMSMWETSRLPEAWRSLMEQNYVRHLIVPSKSQVELFRQGYDGEIDVVPLGVNPNIWKPIVRPQREQDSDFVILLYGLLSARKAPIETIVETAYRAFSSSAFGEPVDNWRIILKTRQGIISGGKINDEHVEILNGDYTPQELHALTAKADLGIILSRYEGFGLVAREMMASGLPVILSDNSGHSDICDHTETINIPVPTGETISAKEMYQNDKENWTWEEPNFEYAARKLREQYDDWIARGRTQSEMGLRASKVIHENYTWSNTAKKYSRHLGKSNSAPIIGDVMLNLMGIVIIVNLIRRIF
jgi:glycosyltransferase involved in cell wall biosynthesis